MSAEQRTPVLCDKSSKIMSHFKHYHQFTKASSWTIIQFRFCRRRNPFVIHGSATTCSTCLVLLGTMIFKVLQIPLSDAHFWGDTEGRSCPRGFWLSSACPGSWTAIPIPCGQQRTGSPVVRRTLSQFRCKTNEHDLASRDKRFTQSPFFML